MVDWRIGGGCGAKKGFEIAHTADLRRHWALRIIVIYDDDVEKDENDGEENPFWRFQGFVLRLETTK